jgi:hypothetical protein
MGVHGNGSNFNICRGLQTLVYFDFWTFEPSDKMGGYRNCNINSVTAAPHKSRFPLRKFRTSYRDPSHFRFFLKGMDLSIVQFVGEDLFIVAFCSISYHISTFSRLNCHPHHFLVICWVKHDETPYFLQVHQPSPGVSHSYRFSLTMVIHSSVHLCLFHL